MQQSIRILMFVTLLTANFFTLDAGLDQESNQPKKHHHHTSYASFFLTTNSNNLDVIAGENLIFNDQVTLSGIGYDETTGVFTLNPGTYAVTYFFAPFSIPSVNMYVNDQLILNSPLGGSSTIFTVEESVNTLTLQYITINSFSTPGVNNSWASIAIFQLE